jgi:hypothetical protein
MAIKNRRFPVVDKSSNSPTGHGSSLAGLSTCAVIIAFGALWFEFFRNIATLPRELMFWHFHF